MKKINCPLVCCLLVLCMSFALAQDTPPPVAEGGAGREIRIDLPEGKAPLVKIHPGHERIRLELPQGSRFPLDFKAASGGLLREGRVTASVGDRLHLELVFAMGFLESVSFEEDAVVLVVNTRQGANSGQLDDEESYHLGGNDVIGITVYGHPELSATLTISQAGSITMPLLGEIIVSGMTASQLSGRLTELMGRDYLVSPRIDVEVEEYRSQWVMVAGEVASPARVALKGGTRLKEVLSETGSFIESSGEEITISREIDGVDEMVMMVIERRAYEDGRSNPLLTDGDIVTISRADYAYLQGEVSTPGRIRIERGMTLLRAIAISGGLTDWANQKTVKILLGQGNQPQYHNLKRIRQGKDQDPLLLGGEMIVVDRRFF